MNPWDEVLHYWFGRAPDDLAVAREKSSLWWSKNAATDATVRRRFEPLVGAAKSGNLDPWRACPRGSLALILLTDQFPRNIYRGTPAAFACDRLARGLCTEGLAQGQDQRLRPIHRLFFYLPLEHAEDLADQNRSVALFRALADQAPAPAKALFDEYLGYALGHRAIIERFGRFPHRNRIVSRQSSAEETAFLQQPNSSY